MSALTVYGRLTPQALGRSPTLLQSSPMIVSPAAFRQVHAVWRSVVVVATASNFLTPSQHVPRSPVFVRKGTQFLRYASTSVQVRASAVRAAATMHKTTKQAIFAAIFVVWRERDEIIERIVRENAITALGVLSVAYKTLGYLRVFIGERMSLSGRISWFWVICFCLFMYWFIIYYLRAWNFHEPCVLGFWGLGNIKVKPMHGDIFFLLFVQEFLLNQISIPTFVAKNQVEYYRNFLFAQFNRYY